jgi:hypothetical protein
MAEAGFNPQVTHRVIDGYGVIVNRGVCGDRGAANRERKTANQQPGERKALTIDAIQGWLFAQGLHSRFLFRLFDAPMPGARTGLGIMQQRRIRGMLELADCESPHRMPHILLPFSFGRLKCADSCDVDSACNSFENANHSQQHNGWGSRCRDSRRFKLTYEKQQEMLHKTSTVLTR